MIDFIKMLYELGYITLFEELALLDEAITASPDRVGYEVNCENRRLLLEYRGDAVFIGVFTNEHKIDFTMKITYDDSGWHVDIVSC